MDVCQYWCVLVIVLVSGSQTVSAYTVNLVVVNREATSYDGLTCWTCPNKTDNEACNDWAPDITCPHGHTWCKTLHRVNSLSGESVVVDKQCVMPAACQEDIVGCHETDMPGVKDCISCCNEDYCNEHAPSNHTSAHRLSSHYGNSAAMLESHVIMLWIPLVIALTRSWRGV